MINILAREAIKEVQANLELAPIDLAMAMKTCAMHLSEGGLALVSPKRTELKMSDCMREINNLVGATTEEVTGVGVLAISGLGMGRNGTTSSKPSMSMRQR